MYISKLLYKEAVNPFIESIISIEPCLVVVTSVFNNYIISDTAYTERYLAYATEDDNAGGYDVSTLLPFIM